MQVAVVEQRLHQKRYAAYFEHVFGDITAAWLQIRDIRCHFEDFGDFEPCELDPAFVSDGRKVQRRIRRAARGRNGRGGVLERLVDLLGGQTHRAVIGRMRRRAGPSVSGGSAGEPLNLSSRPSDVFVPPALTSTVNTRAVPIREALLRNISQPPTAATCCAGATGPEADPPAMSAWRCPSIS